MSAPFVQAVQEKLTHYAPQIEKTKEFYTNNKEIILIIGATTLTYYLMRPSAAKK